MIHPVDSFTKLLLHYDRNDGGTKDIDYSGNNNQIIFNNGAKISTAQKKFGLSSLLLNGSTDSISITDNDDFILGKKLWTFQTWFRANSVADNSLGALFNQFEDINNFFSIFIEVADGPVWTHVRSGGTELLFAYALNPLGNFLIDTWYHIAVVRYGTGQNQLRTFINGSLRSQNWISNLLANTSFPDFNANPVIGFADNQGDTYFPGNIDETRLDVGVARYSSDFIPQAAPFNSIGNAIIT